MKSNSATSETTFAGLSGYRSMIQVATGAPRECLGILENIMRQEVFHSTLDWQTRTQFNRGAKRAYAIYLADADFYEASAALHACEYPLMCAEQELKAAQDAGDVEAAAAAAARVAKAESQRELARQNYERVCGYAVA